MPKAEVGSTKWLANNMKMKGLQRLRWYCQACGKQMRDENGFKQHTMSEGHVRTMLNIGEDPRKYINDFSNQFQRDFLSLLRTAHGEKKIFANHFYQEYIADKQHVHMNATKWPSLTEFVKHLGRSGICRVDEGERGVEIAWIDDSSEALRRKEAVLKRDRMAKGDEEREAKRLADQIRRAKEQKVAQEPDPEDKENPSDTAEPPQAVSFSLLPADKSHDSNTNGDKPEPDETAPVEVSVFSKDAQDKEPTSSGIMSFGLGDNNKDKGKMPNPFKSSRKKRDVVVAASAPEPAPAKKMSQAELIMRREMEQASRYGNKRPRHF